MQMQIAPPFQSHPVNSAQLWYFWPMVPKTVMSLRVLCDTSWPHLFNYNSCFCNFPLGSLKWSSSVLGSGPCLILRKAKLRVTLKIITIKYITNKLTVEIGIMKHSLVYVETYRQLLNSLTQEVNPWTNPNLCLSHSRYWTRLKSLEAVMQM